MFWKRGEMHTVVRIFESEIQAIAVAAQQFPRSETGGDLYGTFTHGNLPVIWLASGPGPKAKHLETHFEQDVSFINHWQERLMKEFGIQYIGSWHSHHFLSLKQPSGGDIQAARNYAIKHSRHRTLEIIVNHEGRKPVTSLRPYFYPNAQEEGWVPASFETLKNESPIRHRLGPDEAVFSAGVDWRTLADHSLYKLETHQVDREIPEIPFTDDGLETPAELRSAIKSLAEEGIEIEQRGNLYMILIPVGDRQLIAVAIDCSRALDIAQVNLIDEAGTNTDVTDMLRHGGLRLTIDKRNVAALSNIAAFIRKNLEREGSPNYGILE